MINWVFMVMFDNIEIADVLVSDIHQSKEMYYNTKTKARFCRLLRLKGKDK